MTWLCWAWFARSPNFWKRLWSCLGMSLVGLISCRGAGVLATVYCQLLRRSALLEGELTDPDPHGANVPEKHHTWKSCPNSSHFLGLCLAPTNSQISRITTLTNVACTYSSGDKSCKKYGNCNTTNKDSWCSSIPNSACSLSRWSDGLNKTCRYMVRGHANHWK